MEDNKNTSLERTNRNNIIRLLCPVIAIAIFYMYGSAHFWFIGFSWVGFGLSAFGLLFTYIGILFYNSQSLKNVRYTGTCQGTVASRFVNSGTDAQGEYYVEHKFDVKYIVKGEIHHVTSSVSSNKKLPKKGASVDVFYDEAHPGDAQTSYDKKDNQTFAFWFFITGIIILAIGLVAFTIT